MHPPSSSTSDSSSRAAWADLARTAAWTLVFLAAFELVVWICLGRLELGGESFRAYFWYGESYETKLRKLVKTPNLPHDSILYAGWVNPMSVEAGPSRADITFYGMSFSKNLEESIHKLRPDLALRHAYGPGAPITHSHALYELDRTRRTTRAVVIGVVSEAVQDTILMNRGSLYSDFPIPYFFPRYEARGDRAVRVADSAINSSDELAGALADPGLWEKQLSILARHDDGFRRYLFAANASDHSALARLVRRSLARNHAEDYKKSVYGPKGFDRDHEVARVYRAVLRGFVRDVRAENALPVVVLFSTQGYSNHLYELSRDVLLADRVPTINSFDICSSERRENYLDDNHFTPRCDLAIARATLELIDRRGAR